MRETIETFKDGRTITTRLSRFGERPDREFDIQFWQGLRRRNEPMRDGNL